MAMSIASWRLIGLNCGAWTTLEPVLCKKRFAILLKVLFCGRLASLLLVEAFFLLLRVVFGFSLNETFLCCLPRIVVLPYFFIL